MFIRAQVSDVGAKRWGWALPFAFFALACNGTGPETCTVQLDSGCWTFLGLEGERVTTVAETPRWGLMAGTFNHGLFQLNPAIHSWVPVGLAPLWISSILYTPSVPPRLFVGVIPIGEQQTDAALFAKEIGDLNWQPWDGGLAARHDGHRGAHSIAMDPGNANRLFMGTSYPILRSEDGGRTWRSVWLTEDDFGMGVSAILVSPARDGHTWAVGRTALFTAFVLRSSDWGDSWQFVDPTPQTDNGVVTLAVDSSDDQRLFAGDTFGVLASEDGGASWRRVLSTQVPGFVAGLVTVAGALYAVANENQRLPADTAGPPISDLGLYRSQDGGHTWDTMPVPPGLGGARAVALDLEGRLLIGTDPGPLGLGLWRVDLLRTQ